MTLIPIGKVWSPYAIDYSAGVTKSPEGTVRPNKIGCYVVKKWIEVNKVNKMEKIFLDGMFKMEDEELDELLNNDPEMKKIYEEVHKTSLCPKCNSEVTKRMIKKGVVWDCKNCPDQIADGSQFRG